MKKRIIFVLTMLALVMAMAGCSPKETKQVVTCPSCSGTGEVKYYYGNGDEDYNMGPCTGCDGTGKVEITVTGKPSNPNQVVCGSCGKYVDELITKEDEAGENRTWCAECWTDYDDLMGR